MESLEKERLKQDILEMAELPTLPSNVLVLMEILQDPQTPASEAIERIEQDQVMSARVLKLANSSYYSNAYGVGSIRRAVTMLGYHEIWKLLVGSSAMEIISTSDLNLWLHSYTSSILMKEMVEWEKISCSSTIQLTMLMHDLGKVALLNFDNAAYRKVQHCFDQDGTMAHTVEEAQLGVNHAEVGAWLLEKWGLYEDQVLPIAHHHDTVIPEHYAKETILIKLVDYLDHTAREHTCLPPSYAELERVGLGEIDLERWIEHHIAKLNELKLFDLPNQNSGA